MIAVDQFTLIEMFLFYLSLCLGPLNGNSQRPEPRKQITFHGNAEHGHAVICHDQDNMNRLAFGG